MSFFKVFADLRLRDVKSASGRSTSRAVLREEDCDLRRRSTSCDGHQSLSVFFGIVTVLERKPFIACLIGTWNRATTRPTFVGQECELSERTLLTADLRPNCSLIPIEPHSCRRHDFDFDLACSDSEMISQPIRYAFEERFSIAIASIFLTS